MLRTQDAEAASPLECSTGRGVAREISAAAIAAALAVFAADGPAADSTNSGGTPLVASSSGNSATRPVSVQFLDAPTEAQPRRGPGPGEIGFSTRTCSTSDSLRPGSVTLATASPRDADALLKELDGWSDGDGDEENERASGSGRGAWVRDTHAFRRGSQRRRTSSIFGLAPPGDDENDEENDGGGGPNDARACYHILHAVGSGAFAAVWLVHFEANAREHLLHAPPADEPLPEHAVMKVPAITDAAASNALELREAARREAELLATLRHPNVVRVLGVDPAGDVVFLPYCAEGDIASVLQRYASAAARSLCPGITNCVAPVEMSTEFRAGVGLPEELIWIATIHVAEALRYLHFEAGVVHRDVKPQNLLIDDDGRVILCDFGVACRVPAPHCVPGSKLRRLVVPQHPAAPFSGTTNYAAPELLDREAFDGRADMWALGCTIFELMSGGKRAFDGKTVAAVIGRIVMSARPTLTPEATGYSAELCSLVESLLVQDVQRRPTSLQLLGAIGDDAVQRALSTSFIESFAACLPDPSARRPLRNQHTSLADTARGGLAATMLGMDDGSLLIPVG